MIKYFFLLIISLFTAFILLINFQLYSENETITEKRADIINQLNFLESELKDENLGNRMQEIFPEGFVFIHVLYGLSWCELALSDSIKDPVFQKKALSEALFAFNKINSEHARSTFDQSISPEYGIFYCGWKNYLLSKILMCDTTFPEHSSYIETYRAQCINISNAIIVSGSPFLQSYKSQSWPADMLTAMASLSNHDRIFNQKYQKVISNWIQKILVKTDPQTHLIPHKTNSETGNTLEGARGSSQSLILRLLYEIDPATAKKQYQIFKPNFITTTFGLPSLREYPKGMHGTGDIDSGPVIFGVSFSGTIVMIGTYAILENHSHAELQYKTVNAFGFGYTDESQKKYLAGYLPVADAFIAWGRASSLNYCNEPYINETKSYKFLFLSLTLILACWAALFHKSLSNQIINMRKPK